MNNVCTQECKQLQDSGYTYLDVRTPDENAQVQKNKYRSLVFSFLFVCFSLSCLCVSVSRVCVGLFCRSLYVCIGLFCRSLLICIGRLYSVSFSFELVSFVCVGLFCGSLCVCIGLFCRSLFVCIAGLFLFVLQVSFYLCSWRSLVFSLLFWFLVAHVCIGLFCRSLFVCKCLFCRFLFVCIGRLYSV